MLVSPLMVTNLFSTSKHVSSMSLASSRIRGIDVAASGTMLVAALLASMITGVSGAMEVLVSGRVVAAECKDYNCLVVTASIKSLQPLFVFNRIVDSVR